MAFFAGLAMVWFLGWSGWKGDDTPIVPAFRDAAFVIGVFFPFWFVPLCIMIFSCLLLKVVDVVREEEQCAGR